MPEDDFQAQCTTMDLRTNLHKKEDITDFTMLATFANFISCFHCETYREYIASRSPLCMNKNFVVGFFLDSKLKKIWVLISI